MLLLLVQILEPFFHFCTYLPMRFSVLLGSLIVTCVWSSSVYLVFILRTIRSIKYFKLTLPWKTRYLKFKMFWCFIMHNDLLRFAKGILLLGVSRSILTHKLSLNLWASEALLFSVFFNIVSIFYIDLVKLLCFILVIFFKQ